MYQLSHLLTEQRSLIVTLLENSLLGDKAPGLRGVEKPDTKAKFKAEVAVNLNVNNQEGRKRLTALLEKVEGCAVSIWKFNDEAMTSCDKLLGFFFLL